MSINKVFITGNLTRDPELRSTASGMPVLGFGVAVNDRVKNNQTGHWEDRPNFVDCTMFGARAESVSRFLSKGSKVAIEGKLHYSSWERDGQKRSKLDVTVDNIEFMSRSDGAQHPAPQTAQYAPQPVYGAHHAPVAAHQPMQQQMPVQQPVQQPVVSSVYDEDIPF